MLAGYQLTDGRAVSVALWVRHSVLGRTGTILSSHNRNIIFLFLSISYIHVDLRDRMSLSIPH